MIIYLKILRIKCPAKQIFNDIIINHYNIVFLTSKNVTNRYEGKYGLS